MQEPRITARTPHFVSVMFTLDDEGGHVYMHNVVAGRAAAIAGWTTEGWARAQARLRHIPANWKLRLGLTHGDPRGAFGRIAKWIALVASFRRLLREAGSSVSRPIVLYADWFDIVHLQIMAAAVWLTRLPEHGLHIWLTYRDPFPPRAAWIQRRLYEIIERRIGSGHISMLTDSALLAPLYEAEMRRTSNVMPIATTRDAFDPSGAPTPPEPDASEPLQFWWPGRPAPHKGQAVIERLLSIPHRNGDCIRLLLSERFAAPSEPTLKMLRVPDPLTPHEFTTWMKCSDIVLLPYDDTVYRRRNSGIFVEAAVAGKPAYVKDDTWMAHELRRFGFPQFIVNWEDADVLSDIVDRTTDPETLREWRRFCDAFCAFHTLSSFSDSLRRIWQSQMSPLDDAR